MKEWLIKYFVTSEWIYDSTVRTLFFEYKIIPVPLDVQLLVTHTRLRADWDLSVLHIFRVFLWVTRRLDMCFTLQYFCQGPLSCKAQLTDHRTPVSGHMTTHPAGPSMAWCVKVSSSPSTAYGECHRWLKHSTWCSCSLWFSRHFKQGKT